MGFLDDLQCLLQSYLGIDWTMSQNVDPFVDQLFHFCSEFVAVRDAICVHEYVEVQPLWKSLLR